jgi:hypothetical protein
MKLADGNNQLGTGKNSMTTLPRRNIPMTRGKYGRSAERIFNSLSAKSVLAGEKLVATYSIST